MKKILALILAMLLVMSSVAFAEVADAYDGNKIADAATSNKIAWVNEGETGTLTDNSSLATQSNYSRFTQEDGTTGVIDTELWMNVAANGQIDVTVPLVLVFSTNIDGGDAAVAENYQIYNNNTRNSISIDKIAVTTISDKMKLVESETVWTADVRDEYYVTMKPDFVVPSGNHATNNQSPEDWKYDLKNATDTTEYDETASKAKVLFQIGEGNSVNMKPYMNTTPLTFVTAQSKDGGVEATKGIELLNIVYTVSLKYDTINGENIPANNETLNAANANSEHNHR